ncbi:TIGR03986 family CRISPR-associated RAMP protein [Phycisphaerales bacterium]|nr:TIGR03986 family CRISPR-associated RAMP protein [Phycisphaerales bacterium]
MSENTIKAELKVKDNGKGKPPTYEVTLISKKGKPTIHSVPASAKNFRDSDASDGMEVDVVVEKGKPVKITVPGTEEVKSQSREELMARSPQGGRGGPQRHGSGGRVRRGDGPAREDATAPYNFVSISQNRVAGGWIAPRPGSDTYSGVFRCELTALTPLIVGGAGKEDERPRDHDKRREPRTIEWCMVNGTPVIPGTSLKGCLRGAVESLSFSSLGSISETTLAARDVSDPKSVYHDRIKRAGGVRAGFLVKRGPHRYLIPCDVASIETIDVIEGLRLTCRDIDSADRKTEAWAKAGTKPVPFDPSDFQTPDGETKREATNLGKGATQGWPVFTGFIQKKRRDAVFFNPAPNEIQISAEIWNAFEDQMTDPQKKLRKARENSAKKAGMPGMPIYWLPTDQSGLAIDAIGLARFFRLPVKNQPRDLAPRKEDDFVRTLFGSVSQDDDGPTRRGRAWATAGWLSDGVDRTPSEPTNPVVPGQPQPSATSLYLQQDLSKVSSFGQGPKNRPQDYDADGASLRGRKLYWHRDPEFPPPPNQNMNVQVRYRPLPKGTRFTFEVMVESVSLAELGGIVHALEYPDGHAHRLGGGKPFGMGSIRIEILDSNVISDQRRYSSLADRAKARNEPFDRELARTAFEQAIAERLGFGSDLYESQPEISEFRRMTSYDNRPANAATSYMPLSSRDGTASYKDKPILRGPRST